MTTQAATVPLREAMRAYRLRCVRAALAAAGGNKTRAAKVLGVDRSYLIRLLRAAHQPERG